MIRSRSYITYMMVAGCTLSACVTFASHKKFAHHLNAKTPKYSAAPLKSVNPFALPDDVDNASFKADPLHAISTLKHARKVAHKATRQKAQEEKAAQKAFLAQLKPIQEDNLSEITLGSDGEFKEKSRRSSVYSNREEEESYRGENEEAREKEGEDDGEFDHYEDEDFYCSDNDEENTPTLSPRARKQVEFLKNLYPSKDWDL